MKDRTLNKKHDQVQSERMWLNLWKAERELPCKKNFSFSFSTEDLTDGTTAFYSAFPI